jgi:hypothetical protein
MFARDRGEFDAVHGGMVQKWYFTIMLFNKYNHHSYTVSTIEEADRPTPNPGSE